MFSFVVLLSRCLAGFFPSCDLFNACTFEGSVDGDVSNRNVDPEKHEKHKSLPIETRHEDTRYASKQERRSWFLEREFGRRRTPSLSTPEPRARSTPSRASPTPSRSDDVRTSSPSVDPTIPFLLPSVQIIGITSVILSKAETRKCAPFPFLVRIMFLLALLASCPRFLVPFERGDVRVRTEQGFPFRSERTFLDRKPVSIPESETDDLESRSPPRRGHPEVAVRARRSHSLFHRRKRRQELETSSYAPRDSLRSRASLPLSDSEHLLLDRSLDRIVDASMR